MAILSMAALRDNDTTAVCVGYVVPWKKSLVSDLSAIGVTVVCLGGGRRGGLLWPLRLRRLIREKPIHIVHSHTPSVAAAMRLIRLSLSAREQPRLISTDHNVWSAYRKMTKIACRATFAMDDAHIAVSDAVRESFPRSLRSAMKVLRYGVPLNREDGPIRPLAPDLELALRKADGEILVVTVANLRNEKGYPDLLRAASIVIGRHPEVRFLAAGQGPLDVSLRQAHRDHGLGEHFVFLGYRRDVWQLMAAADVFVLASHMEGLPLAMLEAMSLGKPVVATAVGGIPEVLTHGREGLIVEPGRPHELARAIETLASDAPLRQQMGRAARERSRSFDMRATAEQLSEIHAGLLP